MNAKVTPLRPDDDLPWEPPPEPASAPDAAPDPTPATPEPATRRKRQRAEAPSEPPADEPDQTPFPFTPLGHDHGNYYYLGHGTRQVTCLKASQHSSLALLQLAPASYWGRRWPSKKGFDVDQAASDLITHQHALGIYDPTRLRGRGAWWDKRGFAIVHLGDRLLVDGEFMGLHEHSTENIYECAVSIPVDTEAPMKNAEAHQLEQICSYLSWESPTSGRLLAGFFADAPICGALSWKPNVWIQGEAGSGKSTIFDEIGARCLGKNRLAAVGGTTEPALRNVMKSDAMPILIDDLDSSSDRGRQANQQILALMRVFSGEDGGSLAKGSQSGIATVYRVHSCYIFSSIVVEADKTADKSRIAILKLLKRKFEPGQLEELKARIRAALPADFAPRFYARQISLIPIIRKNAETFAKAIASITGQQRSGDLYGHLYAGAYSLGSRGLVTLDEAMTYVGNREEVMAMLVEQKQDVVENHEGSRCLAHLLEQVVMDTEDGRAMRASIYDLIQETQLPMGGEHAHYLLRRNGIIVKGFGADATFYVANDHTQLRAMYEGSTWPTGWAGVLKSIPGSRAEPPMGFGGRITRSTSIPLTYLSANKNPAEAG